MLQYGACDNKKELNNIKILLENCIKLLHNDLNSQVININTPLYNITLKICKKSNFDRNQLKLNTQHKYMYTYQKKL